MLFRSLRNFFYQSSCSFCVFITFCLAFGYRECGIESVIINQANFGDMSFLKRPRFICEKQLNERFIIFNITGFWFYQICQIKSTIIPLNLSTPASLFLKSILKSPINIMFSCLSLCVYVCVCLRLFTMKASSVWIIWDTRRQINNVMLKTLISYAKSLHCYFRIQPLTFLTSHFILFAYWKRAKPRLN